MNRCRYALFHPSIFCSSALKNDMTYSLHPPLHRILSLSAARTVLVGTLTLFLPVGLAIVVELSDWRISASARIQLRRTEKKTDSGLSLDATLNGAPTHLEAWENTMNERDPITLASAEV